MQQLKIFLSSRNKSKFEKKVKGYTLEELRKAVKEALESDKILAHAEIKVIINEDSFIGDLTTGWFEQCFQEMRESHFIVILYSGEAGYADNSNIYNNGICYEEYLIAANEFATHTYIIDISHYFKLPTTGKEKEKNDRFAKSLESNAHFKESIDKSTKRALETEVIDQIRQKLSAFIFDGIELSKLQGKSSNVFNSTLDWSKMNYSERISNMSQILKRVFDNQLDLQGIIKAYHVVPDHMSVADARNKIDRPFLEEYKLVLTNEGKKDVKEKGVIHIIGVYGNGTQGQAKNLVGYPDVAAIKTTFGFYLWDKIRHIQIFFLKNCINPEIIPTRCTEVGFWLRASREKKRIHDRAAARYRINRTISEVQVA